VIALRPAPPFLGRPNPGSSEGRIGVDKQARFQLRQMDDATECLDAVLSDIHRTMSPNQDGMCRPQCVAHEYVQQRPAAVARAAPALTAGATAVDGLRAPSTFGLQIMEQGLCTHCHSTSEPFAFGAFLEYVPVALLRQLAQEEERIRAYYVAENMQPPEPVRTPKTC